MKKWFDKKGIERMKKKGLLNWDIPLYLVIALVLLGIMISGYLVISGKLTNAIEYVRNILRFGG